jgi:hypothetical protein
LAFCSLNKRIAVPLALPLDLSKTPKRKYFTNRLTPSRFGRNAPWTESVSVIRLVGPLVPFTCNSRTGLGYGAIGRKVNGSNTTAAYQTTFA